MRCQYYLQTTSRLLARGFKLHKQSLARLIVVWRDDSWSKKQSTKGCTGKTGTKLKSQSGPLSSAAAAAEVTSSEETHLFVEEDELLFDELQDAPALQAPSLSSAASSSAAEEDYRTKVPRYRGLDEGSDASTISRVSEVSSDIYGTVSALSDAASAPMPPYMLCCNIGPRTPAVKSELEAILTTAGKALGVEELTNPTLYDIKTLISDGEKVRGPLRFMVLCGDGKDIATDEDAEVGMRVVGEGAAVQL